ncbi:hypothetical protein LCGC14_2132480, partial [marine sediment metagenome]
AENRAVAGMALGDLFARRRIRSLLWVVLIGSLIGHGVLVPLLAMGRTLSATELAGREDSYLRKVLQKARAKKVSMAVKDRLTMPPPPPDPEAVVERAMGESLTNDVAKITGDLLNVDLQKELAAYVRTSLADELAAAAKDIATGRLSEEEIAALHRKFQDRAHAKTVQWRKEYLIEHQEERAAVSTTEWYENQVAGTLFRNMSFQLFTPPGYKSHPPSPQRWRGVYCGQYGWREYHRWGGMPSDRYLRDKLRSLAVLIGGKWRNAGGEGVDQAPGWPGPSLAQAETISARLKRIYHGKFSRRYPKPSWEMSVYGAEGVPAMTYGILTEYYPHRKERMRPEFDKVGRLWADALAASEAYLAQAQQGTAGDKLRRAQQACLKAMREIPKVAGPLLPTNAAQRTQVRWAIVNDVLRKHNKRMYKRWVDGLVAGLSPVIRDFAKGQFKKGIIVHKDGVDQAMKEFPTKIVPLVRRDVSRMLNPKRFFQTVHWPFLSRKYVSKVTGDARVPTDAEVDADLAAVAKMVARWPPEDRSYPEACRKELIAQFADAIFNTTEDLLQTVLTGNLLLKQMNVFVEGVDYADKVQEKLDARAMALKGRGQDLAKLTADGVPDTSAPLVALMFGASKGHGANLEPVQTRMVPGHFELDSPFRTAVRPAAPARPR